MSKVSSVRYLLLPYYVSVSAHLVVIVIVILLGYCNPTYPACFPLPFTRRQDCENFSSHTDEAHVLKSQT